VAAIIAVILFFCYWSQGKKLKNGIYFGVIPCADCEGIQTKLEIKGNSYTIIYEYLGKNVEFVLNGNLKYYGKDIVKIGNGEDIVGYKIINNKELLQLDEDFNIIESNQNYTLRFIE
jgi:hypothetical protein